MEPAKKAAGVHKNYSWPLRVRTMYENCPRCTAAASIVFGYVVALSSKFQDQLVTKRSIYTPVCIPKLCTDSPTGTLVCFHSCGLFTAHFLNKSQRLLFKVAVNGSVTKNVSPTTTTEKKKRRRKKKPEEVSEFWSEDAGRNLCSAFVCRSSSCNSSLRSHTSSSHSRTTATRPSGDTSSG